MTATAKKKEDKYTEAIGRRKTSVARVRLTPASKNHFEINKKDLASYFPTEELRTVVEAPFKSSEAQHYSITINVKGGGVHSQAEAVRHGISRALTLIDVRLRESLKKVGFLKRDPRAKERRKFGLKKARKAPQWSKR